MNIQTLHSYHARWSCAYLWIYLKSASISLCCVELVLQFPARGSTQVLLCLFPGVLWLWHFLYRVGPHPVSSLNLYTFVVSRSFMAGAASQAGDADSSRAPGLTSGLQGSMNVYRAALLLVPQWQCISSFVFYISVCTQRFSLIDNHEAQYCNDYFREGIISRKC